MTVPRQAHGCGGDGAEAAGVRRHVGMAGRHRKLRVLKPAEPGSAVTPKQRLLLLDTWNRSGLPAGDFAALVGLSKYTLYAWEKRFAALGPAGLVDQPRGGSAGSRLPELTKRAILMNEARDPDERSARS